MPPAGFEPVIPASGRPQTHTLYRAATKVGLHCTQQILKQMEWSVQHEVVYLQFSGQNYLEALWSHHSLLRKKARII
jgi:hypothetical protein